MIYASQMVRVPQDYALLIESVVSVATATVQIRNIPPTFKDLQVVIAARSSRSGSPVDDLRIRFGTGGVIDAGSNYDILNYDWRIVSGTLTSASTEAAGQSSISVARFQWPTADINDTDTFGEATMQIPGYQSTNFDRLMFGYGGAANAVVDPTDSTRIGHAAGKWRNTATIDSLDFFMANGNVIAGSEFRVYGLGSLFR